MSQAVPIRLKLKIIPSFREGLSTLFRSQPDMVLIG
jgi:hypothetical protein